MATAVPINDFRSKLTQGGIRPSQFRVSLFQTQSGNINSALKSDILSNIGFLAKAATLPASTIQSIDVPYRGRMVKIAGERVFQNWSITILNDGDFAIKAALEKWSSLILEHSNVNGILSPYEYSATMRVDQLDRNDNIKRSYQFYNCWPVIISDIQLNYADTQQIEEYNVEFSVDYWEAVSNNANPTNTAASNATQLVAVDVEAAVTGFTGGA